MTQIAPSTKKVSASQLCVGDLILGTNNELYVYLMIFTNQVGRRFSRFLRVNNNQFVYETFRMNQTYDVISFINDAVG